MNWTQTQEMNFGLLTARNEAIPLEGVSVRGHITGRSVKVTVSQTYRNTESVPVEAIYKFPLPDESAVCGFRIIKDGSTLTGVMEERDEAFRKYDEALEQGDRGYLLDQERPNVFTLSVGNLAPNSHITVEIDFVSQIDANGPEVRFMLPTTIAPRYVPNRAIEPGGMPTDGTINSPIAAQGNYDLSIKLTVDDAARIASIESPSHSVRYLHGEKAIAVEFTSEAVPMDRDFILNIHYKELSTTRVYLFAEDDAVYVQLDYMQPKAEGTAVSGEGREVVFVIDCSGSMEGPSLEQAKRALEILLRGLPQGMSFNIYRFGDKYEKFFPSSLLCDEKSCKKALNLLNKMDPDLGGTEVIAPLKDIFSSPKAERGRDIILLTDGDIGNEGEVMELARRHRESSRLSIIGIGYGPNEFLIRQASKSGGGSYEMIAPGERLEPKVLRLVGKVLLGAPVKVRLTNLGEAELAPAEAIVFGGETIALFARLKPTSSNPQSVTLMVDEKEVSVSVVPVSDNSVPIPTLWGRQMISQLEDSGSLGGSRQIVRKQNENSKKILELAKKYSLMSSQSSFVLVATVPDDKKHGQEIELRRIPIMLTRGWGERQPRVCASISMPAPMSPDRMYDMKIIEDRSSPYTISDRYEEHRRPSSEQDIIVYELLGVQRPEGGFEINRSLFERLFNSDLFETINDAASLITTDIVTEKLQILWTMIVLRVLEVRYRDLRMIWEPLVMKSQNWLQQEVQKTNPQLSGKPLDEYVAHFLATL